MKFEIALTLFLFLLVSSCSHEPPPQAEAKPASLEIEVPKKIWTEDERRFLLSELDRTTAELKKETENLGEDQWHFKEDRFRWSIAEIVEHLTLQNELHYREITVLADGPELPQYLSTTKGQDDYYKAYATAPEKSQAKWFLQPLGRFRPWRQHMNGFLRARDGLRDFVEATDVDLRKHFTFRNKAGTKNISELNIGDVRDLHQLVLTEIAHTDRHLRQIRQVKKHEYYPKDL